MNKIEPVLNRFVQATFGTLLCLACAQIFNQTWLFFVALSFALYGFILLIYALLLYFSGKTR